MANHLLRGQPWLRERLVPFSGQVARLRSFPLDLLVRIDPAGELAQAEREANPHAVLHAPPLALLGMATGDQRARARFDVSGDAAFAAALAGVLRELRWDLEEDLSRVVGDIAARRISRLGESAIEWQRQSARNLLQALAEYLTEEQPVLADRTELLRWLREVDALRDDVERLEKRVARLDRSRSG